MANLSGMPPRFTRARRSFQLDQDNGRDGAPESAKDARPAARPRNLAPLHQDVDTRRIAKHLKLGRDPAARWAESREHPREHAVPADAGVALPSYLHGVS
jgi:hypothetical protein